MRGHHYQRFIAVVVLAFSLLHAGFAHAQAQVFNGRMNAAVGGIVTAKVGKWGFAANDPRIAATGSAIGTGLTYLAVGVATGAVATVGWPALLIGAGISAVVGGSLSLAMDGIMKWMFNTNGTVSTQGGSVTVADPTATIYPSSDPQGANCQMTSATNWCGPQDAGSSTPPLSLCLAVGAQNPTNLCRPGWDPVKAQSLEEALTRSGMEMGTTTTGSNLSFVPVSEAMAALTPTELAKPVSDEMLAAAANAAWKAASTDQGGLPWSASDPITPADVAQWRASNPASAPTVGDMMAPVTNGTAVTVGPSAIPAPGGAPQPVPGPQPSPGTGTQVDLGVNPNLPAPGLETTPTAQQILGPLLNLMPDLKNFAVPAHAGTCPKPSFVAFDKTYAIESHCALVESNRSIIEAAMLLVWSIGAVFIILRA